MKRNKKHFFRCLVVKKDYVDYLYSHKWRCKFFSNTPAEICLKCGMIYYDAEILKAIENHFFSVYPKQSNIYEDPVEFLGYGKKFGMSGSTDGWMREMRDGEENDTVSTGNTS